MRKDADGSDLPRWAVTLEDEFGTRLTAPKAARWRSALDQSFPGLTDETICRAIVGAASSVNDLKRYPALRDVRSWIAASPRSRHTGAVGCMCRDGWVLMCTELDNPFYISSVPCSCPLGDAAIRRMIETKRLDGPAAKALIQGCAELREKSISQAEAWSLIGGVDTMPEVENVSDVMGPKERG